MYHWLVLYLAFLNWYWFFFFSFFGGGCLISSVLILSSTNRCSWSNVLIFFLLNQKQDKASSKISVTFLSCYLDLITLAFYKGLKKKINIKISWTNYYLNWYETQGSVHSIPFTFLEITLTVPLSSFYFNRYVSTSPPMWREHKQQ